MVEHRGLIREWFSEPAFRSISFCRMFLYEFEIGSVADFFARVVDPLFPSTFLVWSLW
jgi:hypothetical protein